MKKLNFIFASLLILYGCSNQPSTNNSISKNESSNEASKFIGNWEPIVPPKWNEATSITINQTGNFFEVKILNNHTGDEIYSAKYENDALVLVIAGTTHVITYNKEMIHVDGEDFRKVNSNESLSTSHEDNKPPPTNPHPNNEVLPPTTQPLNVPTK